MQVEVSPKCPRRRRAASSCFVILGTLLAGASCHSRDASRAAHAPQDAHGHRVPVKLVSGLGPVHHPVTTANREAQQFFNQGLAYLYAFNHAEADRSFSRAAELDPRLAMAHWGRALALGPNYNVPEIDQAAAKAAYD